MIDAETEKRGRSAEPDEKQMQKRRDWKLERMVARQTAEPTGSAINQTFGCDLLDELINYALQFSLPWDGWEGHADGGDFDPVQGVHPLEIPAYVLLREFILGNNQTGLVTNSSGTVSIVGGESPSLAADVFPGQSGIYMGQGATQSTYTFPSATIAAWESFIATAISTSATGTNPAGGAPPSPSTTGSSGSKASGTVHAGVSAMLAALCLENDGILAVA
ncbi:hypothetical protein PHLCEN_2v12774 [Hermanssonia centrifuga]|uniref:Uncharacterized protein n=1 Tax=Hermanssonia centrifuga TaxID=98765 RepID=A0A2R6NG33_9APHY|nr:hypothetical protein PHLCEN_2v12774 [Hermanssonia centrifuga]